MTTRSNFKLNKIKQIGGGSISAEYTLTTQENGSSYENKYSVESSYTAHPDLLNVFSDMNEAFVRAKGQDVLFDISRLELSADLQKKIKAVEKVLSEVSIQKHENMKVTGVSIQHKNDEIVSCVISGNQTHKDGKTVGTATTKIELNSNHYGIEEDLAELCELLESETYSFFYEAKRSQLSLDFDEKEEEEEPAEAV